MAHPERLTGDRRQVIYGIRNIKTIDLWHAIRGLGMWSMSDQELGFLVTQHDHQDKAASQHIAEAARQVLLVNKTRPSRKG